MAGLLRAAADGLQDMRPARGVPVAAAAAASLPAAAAARAILGVRPALGVPPPGPYAGPHLPAVQRPSAGHAPQRH